MNNIMLYKWGIEHGVLFKGGKGSSAGYSGPSEAQLAARRAEERAENDRLRKQARLEALDDERRRREQDKLTAAAAKLEQDKLIAEREKREEMIGDEAAGQDAYQPTTDTTDVASTTERYGKEKRSTAKENRNLKPNKE